MTAGTLLLAAEVAPYRDAMGQPQPAGVHHSLWSAEVGLAELAATGGLAFAACRRVEDLTPADLDDVRVLALATIGETPWPGAVREEIERRVAGGRTAILGLHSATDASRDWAGYGSMIGARFHGHPVTAELPLAVVDPDHPSTGHLPGVWRFHDELYLFTDWQPDNRVLLAMRMGPESGYGKGGTFGSPDLPLAWCRSFGAGRCFYSALGHFAAAWEDARYVGHIAGALTWLLEAS